MERDEVRATERVTIPVKGMHCPACVGKVERALRRVPGVGEATVNLATERATVTFDPASVGVEPMRQAVAAAGYEVPEIPTPEASGAAEGPHDAERREEQ